MFNFRAEKITAYRKRWIKLCVGGDRSPKVLCNYKYKK
jgi:hypothetical protein